MPIHQELLLRLPVPATRPERPEHRGTPTCRWPWRPSHVAPRVRNLVSHLFLPFFSRTDVHMEKGCGCRSTPSIPTERRTKNERRVTYKKKKKDAIDRPELQAAVAAGLRPNWNNTRGVRYLPTCLDPYRLIFHRTVHNLPF